MAHVPRIYVPGAVAAGPLTLSGDAAKRLAGVMRVAAGDGVMLFGGDGREWRTTVESVGKGAVLLQVHGVARQESPPAVAVEAWIGTVRANRFETALEKCVEAGADIIRPVVCEFSQRGDGVSQAKEERWRRIVVEAAEQSGRLLLPVLQPPAPFERALEAFRGAIVFGDQRGIGPAEMQRLLPGSGHAAFVVGPEGGFSPGEVAALRQRGGIGVSLGPYILRTETAAIVGTALLRSLTT